MSKQSVKDKIKRARERGRPSEPFSVTFGGETIDGTFQALPFMQWQKLLASHPPHEEDLVDEGWGFSRATLFPAAVRACMTEPEMDDEDWDGFLETAIPGEIARLGLKVYTLNTLARAVDAESVDLPKPSSTSQETTPPSSD